MELQELMFVFLDFGLTVAVFLLFFFHSFRNFSLCSCLYLSPSTSSCSLCSIENETQGIVCARQVLCHWCVPLRMFHFEIEPHWDAEGLDHGLAPRKSLKFSSSCPRLLSNCNFRSSSSDLTSTAFYKWVLITCSFGFFGVFWFCWFVCFFETKNYLLHWL